MKFRGPWRGLNDRDDKRSIGAGWAHDLRDVAVGDGGRSLESRPGYEVANTSAVVPVGGFADQFTRPSTVTRYYRTEVDGPIKQPADDPWSIGRGDVRSVTSSTTVDFVRGHWRQGVNAAGGIYPGFELRDNAIYHRGASLNSAFAYHDLNISSAMTFTADLLTPSSTYTGYARYFFNWFDANDTRYFSAHAFRSSTTDVYIAIADNGGNITTLNTTHAFTGAFKVRASTTTDGTYAYVTLEAGESAYSLSLTATALFATDSAHFNMRLDGATSFDADSLASFGISAVTFDYNSAAGRIYGLHHGQYQGDPALLCRAQEGLYWVNGSTPQLVIGNAACPQVPSVAMAYGWAYWADGLSPMLRCTTTEGMRIGLIPPTSVSVTTGYYSGGAELNGTYEYVVTVVDPLTSYESNPSSIVTAAPSTTNVQLTVGNNINPSGAVMGLYRRKASSGEPFFRLVTYANYAYTWTDSVVDASVLNVLVNSDNDVPWGTPVLCCFHEQRMYYVYSEYPNRVYYSEFGLPESVPATNWREYGGETGAEVKALASLYGMLVVFTDSGIKVMLGDAPMADTREVVPGIGCVAHGSVVKVGNFLYFAAEDGVYRFDGQTAAKLSGAIQGTWDGLSKTRFKWMVATNDAYRGLYMLSVSRSGQSENDRILVYHYRQESQEPGPWTIWHVAATAFARSDNPHTLYFGGSDGYIRTLGGADNLALTDSGTGITWHWKGGRLDAGYPGQKKRWHYLTPHIVPNDGEIEVGYLLDDSNTQTTTTMDTSSADLKVPIGRRAKGLGVYFGGAASTYKTTVRGFDLDGEVLGRR